MKATGLDDARLPELIGGDIDVSGIEGEGTTVTLRPPITGT